MFFLPWYEWQQVSLSNQGEIQSRELQTKLRKSRKGLNHGMSRAAPAIFDSRYFEAADQNLRSIVITYPKRNNSLQ
jgi:hypothetical protein